MITTKSFCKNVHLGVHYYVHEPSNYGENGNEKEGLSMSREHHTLSMVEARDQLTRLPAQFEDDLKGNDYQPMVKVTKHNKPVLAILPWELYESIVETLEILGDEEQVVALRQGIQEATENKGKPWKTAKKELGWEEEKETSPLQSLETI